MFEADELNVRTVSHSPLMLFSVKYIYDLTA